MAEQFFPGDAVKLKGGGPVMTVQALFSAGRYQVVWVEGGESHEAVYSGEVLRKATPEEQKNV